MSSSNLSGLGSNELHLAQQRQQQRRQQVADAIRSHHPDAAAIMQLLGKTFGARMTRFRSEHVQFGLGSKHDNHGKQPTSTTTRMQP